MARSPVGDATRLILLMLLQACLANGLAANLDPLAHQTWQHRVLLVFAASADDSRAKSLRETLAGSSCQIDERDIVVGWIFEAGISSIGDIEISNEQATALRARLHHASADFGALLIGKDGGVKARYAEPPLLEDILALIDGMPMRQAEARSRPSPCTG